MIETGLRRNVATIEEVGEEPFGIAITPDGKYAYVTDRASDEVAVISTATKKLVKSIPLPVGAKPTGIAISPTGKFAYVADSGVDQVEVINTETMSVTGGPIEVGEGPMGIEFTPGGTAYVVDEDRQRSLGDRHRDQERSPKSRSVAKEATNRAGSRSLLTAPKHSSSVSGAGPISVIDTGTNKVTGEVEVEGEPEEVTFAANGKTVYVTESEPNQVQAINVETGKVAGSPIELAGEFADRHRPDPRPVAGRRLHAAERDRRRPRALRRLGLDRRRRDDRLLRLDL